MYKLSIYVMPCPIYYPLNKVPNGYIYILYEFMTLNLGETMWTKQTFWIEPTSQVNDVMLDCEKMHTLCLLFKDSDSRL